MRLPLGTLNEELYVAKLLTMTPREVNIEKALCINVKKKASGSPQLQAAYQQRIEAITRYQKTMQLLENT